MPIHPLRFEPKIKECIWGGNTLREMYGRGSLTDCRDSVFRTLSQAPVGESWEVHGNLLVLNGPCRGLTLDEAARKLGRDLVGDLIDGYTTFPLLVKWLSASRWLSLQVHPDDDTAREMGIGVGKTECWYVVHNEEYAELISGLRPDCSLPDVLNASGIELLKYVQKVKPKAGETYFIGSGTVHALGPGATVLEVQQSSDVTFRFYDWDRTDASGKPRQLHLQQARASLRHPSPVPRFVASRRRRPLEKTICDCPYFSMHCLNVPVSAQPGLGWDKHGAWHCNWRKSKNYPEMVALVRGYGSMSLSGAKWRGHKVEEGPYPATPCSESRKLAQALGVSSYSLAEHHAEVEMQPGDVWLIPARATKVEMSLTPGATLVRIGVGGAYSAGAKQGHV